MIIGLGVDAVSLQRVQKLDEKTIEKIFNPQEIEEYRALKDSHQQVKNDFLSSRFAVKEAYAKARGFGFCETIKPSEICTCSDSNGKPYIKLSGLTLSNAPKCKAHVSITHQDPLSIAVVILEDLDGKN